MPACLVDVTVWLAAFAISGSLQLISLDRDVQQFLEAGLDLLLLRADAGEAG